MKVYYDKLTKEEKGNIKKEFLETDEKKVYTKASKIVIFCIIGIVISIISGVFDYIYKTGIINYVIDGFLFLFSIIVLFRMQKIKKNLLNRFAISKKKDK